MTAKESVEYMKFRLNALKEDGSWNLYLEKLPGNFEEIRKLNPITGAKSAEEAIEKGKKFIDDHQWQTAETISEEPITINIRLRWWWDNEWGYRISGSYADAGFKDRDSALKAARKAAKQKLAEAKEAVEKAIASN